MSIMDTVLEELKELSGDRTVPKNVRAETEGAITILESSSEVNIKKASVMQILDEISNDPNLPQYTRTQIWNIVSMLEKVE